MNYSKTTLGHKRFLSQIFNKYGEDLDYGGYSLDFVDCTFVNCTVYISATYARFVRCGFKNAVLIFKFGTETEFDSCIGKPRIA